MVWFPKRLPDDKMTPFRPGDLIVPRGTEYREDPAIFLGLSWEHHPKETKDCTTGVTFVEDGWCVYPWVYTPGRYSGGHRYPSRAWGTDWFYIQRCELIRPFGEPTKPSKYWEKNFFKFFTPPPRVSAWCRIKAFLRRVFPMEWRRDPIRFSRVRR